MAFHLLQYSSHIRCLPGRIPLVFQCGVDWQDIIDPIHLNPVSGIIKHGCTRSIQFVAKTPECLVHLGFCGIHHHIHIKTHPLQHLSHLICIVFGIGQRRRVLVGAVADYQSYPLFQSSCRGWMNLNQKH